MPERETLPRWALREALDYERVRLRRARVRVDDARHAAAIEKIATLMRRARHKIHNDD